MNLLKQRVIAQCLVSWQGTIFTFMDVYGPHGLAEAFNNPMVAEGEVFITLDGTSGDFDDNTLAMVSMCAVRNPGSTGLGDGVYTLKTQLLPAGTYNGFNSGGKKVLRVNGFTTADGENLVPGYVQFSMTVWRTPGPATQTY